MMKKIALTTFVLSVVTAAPSAFAQCPPGSWLCADITIGTPPIVVQPPPPPVVVQTAPPPVVYIEPAPPPVVYVQPPPQPPPVVYIRPPPQPPPTVYVQPRPVYVQPRPVYVQPTPTPVYVPPYRQPVQRGYLGLQGQLAGALIASPASGAGMGGLGAGLRFRSDGYFGGEVAFNAVWGRDYNGDRRTEVPTTLSGLFYFNPRNRIFQVYGLLGLGFSVADVSYSTKTSVYADGLGRGASNADAHGRSKATYAYLGAQAGIGFELQLSSRFSLFADLRGFVRGRIDDSHETNPEFARRNVSTGVIQTSNGSIGSIAQGGAVLYF